MSFPTVATLLAEAAERAGLTPGEVPFTANLELLLDSSARTGRLNPIGERVLHRAGVRHLRNLLHLRAHLEAHPEAAAGDLGRPVVVTGLPRTGTTLLHNLLALDPSHRVLRFWEALQPVPPAAGGPAAEVLIAQAERWLDAFYRMVPEFKVIHPATATGPEECDALLQNTFASQHFDDMFDAAGYSAWLAQAPLTSEYSHYGLQLRVLSLPPGHTWALKSPSHLGHLDALFGALPEATVVLCHRHPHQAVASYASLISALRRAYNDSVSPERIGRQALERASTAMRRALEVRAGDRGGSFVDVGYRNLVDDPLGTVRRIYERLQRRLPPAVGQAMARWAVEHPAGRHGPHHYDLARFGLTEQDVDEAFAAYVERFGTLAGP